METLLSLSCLFFFLGILGAGVCAFLVMVASPDYRVFWRTVRRGRFGLKTGFGVTAVVAVTFGLVTMLGMDVDDPGVVCLLVVMVPLAVFIVTLAGLLLSELFDTKSTREIVARRNIENELTAYARERQDAAKRETQKQETGCGQSEVDTEL